MVRPFGALCGSREGYWRGCDRSASVRRTRRPHYPVRCRCRRTDAVLFLRRDPLVAGLFGVGVPLAPVMAFWIASPLMDPTQFFVIAGSLGIGFAIAKTAAAIGMGLLGGYGTMLLTRTGLLEIGDALRVTVQSKSCCSSRKQVASPKPVWRFWQEGERAQVFLTTSTTTAWFLIRWLTLAFAIESLMIAWLPPEVIARWLGPWPFAIPIAVLIGVPVYINGLAAVPFVAGLIELGI